MKAISLWTESDWIAAITAIALFGCLAVGGLIGHVSDLPEGSGDVVGRIAVVFNNKEAHVAPLWHAFRPDAIRIRTGDPLYPNPADRAYPAWKQSGGRRISPPPPDHLRSPAGATDAG